MHATNLPFAAQLRRYRHLAKKVNRLLKSGEFHGLSSLKRNNLLTKLKCRLQRISHLVPTSQLRGAMAGIALLLGGATAQGQTFGPAVNNPFGLNNLPTGYGSFADTDGDGDLDFNIYAYDENSYQTNFLVYENTGDAQNPAFSDDNFLTNPFGIVANPYYSQPIFIDVDNDGDLDLFTGDLGGTGSFYFQENIGSATAPSYSPIQTNPFGVQTSNYINFSAAADIDGDGDIDLFGADIYGSMLFYQNSGTPESPSFGTGVNNPFGIAMNGLINVPAFGDLDGDGDYDLIFMAYPNPQIRYQKNTGTPTNPQFSAPVNNPFGINAGTLTIPIPATADIDGDADVDVFITDYYGINIRFFENLNSSTPVAPTASNNTVIMQEDGVYAFNQIDFNFADANSNDVLQAVQVTELPNKGVLRLGSTPIAQDQLIQVDDIGNLIFDSDPNDNGNIYTSFKFKVSDGSLLSTDAYTMSVVVTPVNDLPETDNAEVDAGKNFPFIFEAADFPYSDVDGDNFSGISVASLPAKGSLKLGANNVTVGQNILVNDLPNLTYTAVPGEIGDNYASFDFKVQDGTAASLQKTMTINVLESTAASDHLLDAKVNLFPNPVVEELQLNVKSEQLLGNVEITMLNAMGQVVYTQKLDGITQELLLRCDASQLVSGTYFLKVESNGKSATSRFVKR